MSESTGWTTTIDALEATFRSLSELGASLDEEQWKTPTDLPAWTVQDNLSHLVAIERALEGLAPTSHQAVDTAHVRNPIGASNENEVDARRSLPGAEVLAEWDAITARRLATLRSADDTYFRQEAMTPTGPGTVADFLSIRVLDCWVHEQDIRRALDLPGHESGPAAEHTIDRLIRTVGIVVGKRAKAPEGSSVVIALTGPVVRTITATMVDGRARVSIDPADAPDAPDARLVMDSATFLALATGRRTADAMSARISTEGDRTLAGAVAGGLNMMI